MPFEMIFCLANTLLHKKLSEGLCENPTDAYATVDMIFFFKCCKEFWELNRQLSGNKPKTLTAHLYSQHSELAACP
jgi:hypothetical protein